MVDGAGFDRNVDGNLGGEFFGGRRGKKEIRRAELDVQKTFFKVARADLFGEKNVDGEARVRFAAKFAEMGLDGAIGFERGIAEFDGRDFERGAFDGERLHVAVADGIVHDLMIDGDVEFVRGEKGFDGVGGGLDERAGFGKRAVERGIFCANGGGEFGIVEPGNVVEEGGEEGVFFDVKGYADLVAASVEVVFDVGEEAAAKKFVGGGLECVAIDGRVQLEFGEGDDLGFGEFFGAVDVNFVESGGGGSGRLGGPDGGQRIK